MMADEIIIQNLLVEVMLIKLMTMILQAGSLYGKVGYGYGSTGVLDIDLDDVIVWSNSLR